MTILEWERSPEPVEITMLTGQGIGGISRIIFGQLWIVGVKYKEFECHVCLLSVGMFSWHNYEQGTQCATQPKTLVNTWTPTGCLEKEE